MKRRSLFGALFAGGVVGAVGASAAMQPATAQTSMIEVFGVVRFPSTGPEVLDDANHSPKGVTSASIMSNGMLQIFHTDLQEVGFSSVTVDETLAGRGFTAGGSQGFSDVRIKIYDTAQGRMLDLNDPTDYSLLGGTNSNIWFYARSADL